MFERRLAGTVKLMTNDDDREEPAAEETDDHRFPDCPDVPFDELAAKADELRAKAFKSGNSPIPNIPEWDTERLQKYMPADSGKYLSLGIGITILYTLLAGLICGLGLGWLIDLWTGSTNYLALGAAIGMALGFANIFLIIKRTSIKRTSVQTGGKTSGIGKGSKSGTKSADDSESGGDED